MHRNSFSAIFAVIAVMIGAMTASPTRAEAFDVCKARLAVDGPVTRGWKPAMAAARDAWQRKAARTHGRRFADWWYSGDRTIECTWDDRGVNYRCRAAALPCG